MTTQYYDFWRPLLWRGSVVDGLHWRWASALHKQSFLSFHPLPQLRPPELHEGGNVNRSFYSICSSHFFNTSTSSTWPTSTTRMVARRPTSNPTTWCHYTFYDNKKNILSSQIRVNLCYTWIHSTYRRWEPLLPKNTIFQCQSPTRLRGIRHLGRRHQLLTIHILQNHLPLTILASPGKNFHSNYLKANLI